MADVNTTAAAGWGALPLPPPSHKAILFVTKTREFGGAEKHLLDLIDRLIGGEVRLSILCLETDFYTERLNQNQVDIINLKSGLHSFWDWYQVFRRIRPDVVVFVRAVPWCYAWYTPVAAWLARIPRRVSIAHLPPPSVPAKVVGWSIPNIVRRFRRTRRLLAWRVSAFFEDAIICVSDAIRDTLIQDYRFPANKTITIRNGVSLSQFDRCEDKGRDMRTRLGLGPQDFLLVCVARLSEQKRIDILLQAMARVLQDGGCRKCIIVGDGPLREELAEQALALGLSDSVIFEGFREDVGPYLTAASAFVLTSDREGFPLSILEAMACGLPCIVTRVGGNSELVIHGVNGLIVSPGSIDEVADAISYLATHPQERAQMSGMAQSRVRQEFDIENQMAQLRRAILS
jgi:glycosyltransferase involved in cell wall biosynthesis